MPIIVTLDINTIAIKGTSMRVRFYANSNNLPYQPGLSGLLQAAITGGTTLLTSDFVTSTGAGTAFSYNVPVPAGYKAGVVTGNLLVPFQNSGDTGQSSTALQIGDSASATTFLASTELNANGTYITNFGNGAVKVYNAADNVIFKFTPTAGKKLSDLDTGVLDVEILLTSVQSVS